MKHRGLIEDESNIIEESRKIHFNVQKELKYMEKNKDVSFIPDAFSIYRANDNKWKVFYLEIENSDRRSPFIAQKTLKNYEGYFLSGKWKKEKWQNPDRKVFPYIIIISYSDYKTKELIKQFNRKIKIPQLERFYLFSDYKTLNEQGISGEVWSKLNGKKVSFL